jgi:Ca2+-binding EF-hand superfamily protein
MIKNASDIISLKEKGNIRLAFEAFDADGSGTIELDELLSTFK